MLLSPDHLSANLQPPGGNVGDDDVRFATDSPLEGTRFEPSVPLLQWSSVQLAARDAIDPAIAKPGTSTVRVDELGRAISACPARLSKAGLQLEIGFRDYEHLAVPFSPSRQVSRSAGTIVFATRRMPKIADETGIP